MTEYRPFPKALWPGVQACFSLAVGEYLPGVMVAYDDPFGILMTADTENCVAIICRTEKTGPETYVKRAPQIRVDIPKLLEGPHRDLRMFKEPLREYAAALEATVNTKRIVRTAKKQGSVSRSKVRKAVKKVKKYD